ncbi:ArsR/SmtB family transcription factor [Listeria booriae]|uniref:Winged helix-turn-helix transcriptional regulator n=2 Tax=Listeria booriae TaxID=1552123 RepID=A0A7X1CHA5_9LIST|nr:metalloregulator ArsR/SmtB family transcription factor [Listeria booriae]MBC1560467.1 winged helix-turn-helix transcriptional regulator [Listeria booriae]MBC1777700.1 winged helix-turn-helix transcriptional regulator [Listeria booriae]MBC2238875.1 winged helix-turn-helix transcriptional regulator [Listeria booriae]MBC2364665.1 winged helix-turn-helix transcriptional regulator [Listeria booriae]
MKKMNLKTDQLLLLFQALGDPIRLDIFLCLLQKGERRVVCDSYDISKSTMSHHIKLLREADLITVRKEGTSHIYSVNHMLLEKYPAFFSVFQTE